MPLATAHPTEVAAALRYAAENKYDYGPKLRDADLQWDVNGIEPMGNGISRVFIDYTPSASFRGLSGSEYIDVDSGGAVLASRQIRVPKQNLPTVLIALTVVSLIALAVVQVLLWANPFEGGPELYVAGRTLWIRAELPAPAAIRRIQRTIQRWHNQPMGDQARGSGHRDHHRRNGANQPDIWSGAHGRRPRGRRTANQGKHRT